MRERTEVGGILRLRGRRLLRAGAVTAASLVPAAVLAYGVRQQFDPVITADRAAIEAATTFSRSHGLTSVLLAVQQLSQPVVTYAVCTPVVVRVGRRRLRGRASWAFATMMTGWALGGVVKVLVRRVRPVLDDPLSHSAGYSFPSGHALNIAIAGSAMIVLVWPLLDRTGRRRAVALATLAGVAVGSDRVLLGVHFPSDVVAGWLLGVGVTAASWWGFAGQVAPSGRAPSDAA